MGQWKGDSLSEEEYNFQNFEKNKGQTGGPLSNFPMEEPKATSAMVTEAPAVKEEKSQAEQLVDWLRSPITQAAGVATAATVGTGMAVKGLLGRGKNVPEEKPRVEPTFTEPPPFAPQKTAQPDVTDVASRPVGQARPQLGGPTTAPTQAPVAPPTAPAPSAPMAPAPSAPMPPAGVVGGAPAPANVAPTPVAPAAPPPVDPIMQAKLDAIADKNRRENEAHAAQQRRLDEIHQTKLANEAKRAEAKVQAGQGKAASPTSVDEQAQALLKKSDKNTIANAVAQASAPKPIAPPPVAPAAQAAAVMPPPNAPITSATPATAPTNPPKPVIETTGLTKEEAGMKKYLTSFYGGGTEGEKAYGKTIEILGKTPAFEQGKGGGLSEKDNQTIKTWRKENIEGPKVNLTYDMKKVMKGAGGLAILTAIPGFAEAAQRKDYGKMTDLASDFFVLPFAQSSEAGMPKKQEESIIAQKFKEAQKLGSPYRSVPPPR